MSSLHDFLSQYALKAAIPTTRRQTLQVQGVLSLWKPLDQPSSLRARKDSLRRSFIHLTLGLPSLCSLKAHPTTEPEERLETEEMKGAMLTRRTQGEIPA